MNLGQGIFILLEAIAKTEGLIFIEKEKMKHAERKSMTGTKIGPELKTFITSQYSVGMPRTH